MVCRRPGRGDPIVHRRRHGDRAAFGSAGGRDVPRWAKPGSASANVARPAPQRYVDGDMAFAGHGHNRRAWGGAPRSRSFASSDRMDRSVDAHSKLGSPVYLVSSVPMKAIIASRSYWKRTERARRVDVGCQMRWDSTSRVAENRSDEAIRGEPGIRKSGMDGGAERDRTAGLLVANEALSQLSYSPTPIDFYILPAFPSLRNSLSEV
jgi:hypothetical protein